MTSGRYGLVLREVGRLLGGGSVASLGAGPLLERFADHRDEAAFEALVSRHGPMVLGTCRRMLADPLDVEDAFQATFLVLARKAGSIRDADRLGPWLHGVARRVAARSRALSGRRKSLERQGIDDPAVESPDLLEGSEVREVLDEELARLPEKYRVPLVLCYLEGLTHDEAAEVLRWPIGTVRSRLSGGRARLRLALTRRGFAPSLAVPAILARATIPQTLLTTTVRVATLAGSPPAHVLNLAKGALIAMTWNKLKLIAAVALTTGLTVGGAGVAAQQGGEIKAEAKADAPIESDGAEPKRGTLDIINSRLNDDQIGEVTAERTRLIAEQNSIARKIEQIRYAQAKTLPDLEKQAEEVRKQIDAIERKWKALAAGGSAKVGDPSKDLEATNKKIMRLEAELQSARNKIQELQRKMEAVSTSMARPLAEEKVTHKPEAPAKDPAQPPGAAKTGKGEGGAAVDGPAPGRVVNLGVEPPLFATITGDGGRVTMIDPISKWKATYQLPGGLVASVTPFSAGNDLFPLAISAHKISQLAVFDRIAWRWKTLDLDGSVKEARPDVGTGSTLLSGGLIGYTQFGPRITRIVAFSPWTREWVTQDLKEPVTSGPLKPSISSEVLTCGVGRNFYAYSIPAKKWANLELKRPIDWGQFPQSYAPNQGGKIIVLEEDAIHTLDIKTGEWTHIDTKEEK